MATITLRGRAWYLQWTGADGKPRRKSLGRVPKTHAEQIRRAKEIELATGQRLFGAAPTLAEFARDYLSWFASEYPASADRAGGILYRQLIPAFGHLPLDRLTPMLVETWKAGRLQQVKAGTVCKELHTLKALLAKAIDWQQLDRHPIKAVKDPRQLDSRPPRWYSVAELQAIYAADPERRYLWQLMANTGLRRGEALNLRAEHVTDQRLRVISSGDARTKSGKWREVPLSPAAQAALSMLTPAAGHLLPRHTPYTLTRAFSRTLRRADLDGNLHCLRHTFCSHLVMAGIPLRTVQILAGHAHIGTTEKYAHLAPDYLSRSAQVLAL